MDVMILSYIDQFKSIIGITGGSTGLDMTEIAATSFVA